MGWCRLCIKEHGLRVRRFEAMRAELMKKQKGVCAICHREASAVGRKKTLEVDHDHSTGHVRGLLCSACNRGIGLFQEDVKMLRKAVAYLEKI